MIRTLLLGTALAAIATPAAAAPARKAAPTTAAFSATNPFAQRSTLPYQAPAFDRIKDRDYEPAMIAGIAEQRREIDAIAADPKPATFDNTIVAMERSGELLERVSLAFGPISSANTNDTVQAIEERMSPRLSAHNDYIYLNPKLFARVKALYDSRATLNLNPEQSRLLQVQYDNFVRAGAQLTGAKQTQLKALNLKLGTLETSFGQKLLAATKAGALHITDKAALAGLGEDEIAAAAEAAKTRKLPGYVLVLQNTTSQPELASLTNRATREALFKASVNRASKNDANDTRPLIAQMAKLRAEKAALLGFPNWAAYKLGDQMAKTPEAAIGFVDRLAPAVAAKQRAEAADIQALIDRQGGGFKAQPWDWDFYSEQIRKERYALDAEALKPFFEVNKVLENGVLYSASQLYGLKFSERKDIPTWNPDMRVFQVNEENGKVLGLMYFDFWKRDNKSGGAWMSPLVIQSTLRGTIPVIYNVSNFTKPAPGKPALISFDDVTTMFHEFGHALHGLFAAQTYPTLSGTNTARDFVEFPSQFNENWALDPKILPNYAVHYQTGQVIPQDLIAKIKTSRTFNQGFNLGESATAARMDLAWHSLPASAPLQDVDAFEAKALAASGFDVTNVPPRYHTPYFRHIWSNGYSASYYAYAWTEMLDHDAFAWFQGNGGLTRANGQRFRDMVLSRGNTLDYATMYRAFAGRDASIQPMLVFRGLTGPAAAPAAPASGGK